MTAIRTWKSDGSKNIMDLGVAVENLRRNRRLMPGTKQYDETELRQRLEAAEVLETTYARFSIF